MKKLERVFAWLILIAMIAFIIGFLFFIAGRAPVVLSLVWLLLTPAAAWALGWPQAANNTAAHCVRACVGSNDQAHA